MKNTTTIILLSIFTAALGACGGDECLPTINADTLILGADPICVTTDELSTGDGSSGDASTGSSSGEAVTSGGACEPPADDGLICGAVPEAGKMWGPCAEGSVCLGDAVCMIGDKGDVCIPACDDCGCPNDGCFGGTCTLGACLPACVAVGDPCPAPGMVCDFMAGACVWPG